MAGFTETLRPRAAPLLPAGAHLEVGFIALDLDTAGFGFSRIVAVTRQEVYVIRPGLLRRAHPVEVMESRAMTDIANPLFAWPGRTALGETYAEILPSLWVHRRYRHEVFAAYGVAVRALV